MKKHLKEMGVTDKTFVYWTADGERCEVPVTVFQVPDGATLGPPHSYLCARTEDIPNAQYHR